MTKSKESEAAAAAAGSDLESINVIGDIVQHVSAGQEASCEFSTSSNIVKENIDVNILSPSKVPVSYR